jgi:hypothetical protein
MLPKDHPGRGDCEADVYAESAACHERVGDGAGVRDRARQPIELGHDEGVAGAHGRKRLIEARRDAVRAGEPTIRVDALGRDPELFKGGLWAARSCLSVEQRA